MDGMDCHGVWMFLIHDPIIIPERTRLVSSTHVDRLMLSQVGFITFSPAHFLQTLESFRVCCTCQILSLLQNLLRITTHGTMILQYLGTWTPGNPGNSTTPSAENREKIPMNSPPLEPTENHNRTTKGASNVIPTAATRKSPEVPTALALRSSPASDRTAATWRHSQDFTSP